MAILPYLSVEPEVGVGVRVADEAVVVGKVRIAGPARIEVGAVLRGDQNWIEVGPRFRIGEGSTIHVEFDTPTIVGADVWVGDGAVVHATTLGDNVRIEHGALVLSTSRVGHGSLVESGALVTEGAEFPENSYISGTPGRRLRDTTLEEREATRQLVAAALGE